MRIKGSGSRGFGHSGGGKGRSETFKRGRRLGQKVHGTLLKWVSKDMAWVLIDEHKLLAQLHSKPAEGAQLTFIIKQLQPDIILKEVFEPVMAETGALVLASDFETARTLFENQFRPLRNSLDKAHFHSRLGHFLTLLKEKTDLFSSFMDATTCLETINNTFKNSTTGRLQYIPWLIPAGRRHITLLKTMTTEVETDNLTHSITEFELSRFGMIRAEFLYKQPTIGYRLKLQNVSRADELKRYLKSRKYPIIPTDIECLGVAKLPQANHGGILAELMFSHPHR